MQKLSCTLLVTAALGAVLWTAPSFAEDLSAGKIINEGDGAKAMGTAKLSSQSGRATPVIKADRSASRALALDEAASEKAFTAVGRKSGGETVRIAPGEMVKKAIKGEKAGDGKRGALDPASTVEPEFATDESARAVVGADGRTPVKNTKTHPYSTIGYLDMKNAKGEVWSCTAAAIGRYTVLTAGHCLYNHEEEGGWRDEFTFWPAINGEKVVPYGGFNYDTAYVFEGFIDDYKGSYDNIWQYDIGLVTFTDPIGDTIGWLGQASDDASSSDFQANLVGYQDDKTPFTMWRSTCNVLAEGIGEADFNHDCDFASGASGAPLYVYDAERKSRDIVGVNIGESGDTNWALRLYPAVTEWIAQINK